MQGLLRPVCDYERCQRTLSYSLAIEILTFLNRYLQPVMETSSLCLAEQSARYPGKSEHTRTAAGHRRNCGKRIPPYSVTISQIISTVLQTMILHSSCSRTVRWKMQSVWITSSTSYRLQIWFCRIRILPLRNTRPLNCCRYPS